MKACGLAVFSGLHLALANPKWTPLAVLCCIDDWMHFQIFFFAPIFAFTPSPLSRADEPSDGKVRLGLVHTSEQLHIFQLHQSKGTNRARFYLKHCDQRAVDSRLRLSSHRAASPRISLSYLWMQLPVCIEYSVSKKEVRSAYIWAKTCIRLVLLTCGSLIGFMWHIMCGWLTKRFISRVSSPRRRWCKFLNEREAVQVCPDISAYVLQFMHILSSM